jgi:hypothetical protein
MAARAFRFELENSSGFSLTKTFDHLCHGDWTPSLRPPDKIESKQTVVWRSESNGIGTGTEAYVKYNIDSVGDTVYIYWDNPFLIGNTHAKWQVSTQDVEPDCDFEKSPPGSGFSPPPSKFEIFETFRGGGAGGPAGIGFIAEIPLAPIIIFGTVGIQDDASIILTLAHKSTSLRTFVTRRGVDPGRDIRSSVLKTGGNSLRSTMGV